METKETYCDGARAWSVRYEGLLGEAFTVREDVLLSLCGLGEGDPSYDAGCVLPPEAMVERAALAGSRRYDPSVSMYSAGKHVGYLRGFRDGAEYVLRRKWEGE